MASTLLVPLGDLAFALPIMPPGARQSISITDVIGLVVILSGRPIQPPREYRRQHGERTSPRELNRGPATILS
jgi:hypothetical protein